MPKYSLQEKYYITLAHPDLELENVEFGVGSCSGRRDGKAEPNMYFTEKGLEAYRAAKRCTGFTMYLHFKDLGPTFRQKFIQFPQEIGFFRLDEPSQDVVEDHRFVRVSDEIEYRIADKDGRFTVELWFVMGEDNEMKIDIPPFKPGIRFVIRNMEIANQFVTEKLSLAGIITGGDSQAKCDIRSARYDFCEQENTDWFDRILPFLKLK